MNRYISSLLFSVLFFNGASFAETDEYARCKLLSRLAETIMEARQVGYPMSTLMDDMAGRGTKEVTQEIDGLIVPLIVEAYEMQSFSTKILQQKTVADFRDLYHLECVKEINARKLR